MIKEQLTQALDDSATTAVEKLDDVKALTRRQRIRLLRVLDELETLNQLLTLTEE